MSRGPGERAGLSREAVVVAARRVAERDGVERFSLRAVARELEVAPNAIYTHVPGKVELLDAVLDDVLGEIADPTAADWRDALVELMTTTRRVVVAHAGLVGLFLSRPTSGEHGRRLGEVSLALLANGGVEGERAVEALRALLAYTLGFAALEAPRRADPDAEGRRRAAEAAFTSDEALPHLRAAAPILARHADDRSFESGLRWLLAGVAGFGACQ
jgi:TetR/AcrR family transcriptional regulator, tetracycline repressor protein